MNPNDPKKNNPANPPRSPRSENDFFQKKNNDPLKVPPGNPESSERDSRKLESLYGYGNLSREQLITYVILVVGLIAVFVDALVGGLIIGGVAGYHFAEEIVFQIKNIGPTFTSNESFSYIVLAALLIGLFIAAPGFFIGAIIVALIKHTLFGEKTN